ncbi:hypothetical protein ACEN88_35875, partial [Massilia sp. CT11-108]|uniref:hypothetical protein n=1 Tax=Massilia sp. CT11-108 TaxID=3393900 RepID=UPI0039A681BD
CIKKHKNAATLHQRLTDDQKHPSTNHKGFQKEKNPQHEQNTHTYRIIIIKSMKITQEILTQMKQKH